ncbi:MAG: hypothetical protein IMZ49_01035 [Actinobacteria bacterium]|nr:hypothetical protein [Actinomycetota bacterium]
MQYKKYLYKILFITILLGFIISLAGCNWFSLGLLNVFDPQSQIRLSELNINDNGTVDMKIFTLNQVEFIGSGFEFDYYQGNSRVTSLDRTASAYYYVAPSSLPGEAGTLTPITDLLLYSTAVLDYVKLNSAFNEITTDLYIAGTDGAGHDLKVKVASGLAALGVDNTSPTANITYEPTSGDCPLTVFFDGSTSEDGGDGLGIAKFEWYLPEISSSIISTDISFSHTFSCALVTDSEEVITVSLTVTDYYGNEGSAAESVTIINPDATSDGGCGS